MRCPTCASNETKIVDSRDDRRTRQCKEPGCNQKFVTIEGYDIANVQVVKSNGNTMGFSRRRLARSIEKAAVARMAASEVTELVDRTVAELFGHRRLFFDRAGDEPDAQATVSTREVGEAVMRALSAPRHRATRLRYTLLFGPTTGYFADAASFRRWLENELPDSVDRYSATEPKFVTKRRKDDGENNIVPFERGKLYNSIKFAVKKRPVGVVEDESRNQELIERLCQLVLEAVAGQRIVSTGQLATETMRVLLHSEDERLGKLIEPGARQLAYLRVASSAKQFTWPQDFYSEALHVEQVQAKAARRARPPRSTAGSAQAKRKQQ